MDITRYKNESSNPKWDAQENLKGRTHYVSDDTLRYHKSRILQTRIAFDGLIFGLVESIPAPRPNAMLGRGMRYVIFDLLGNVIHRPDIAQYRNSAQAAKAMDEIIDGLTTTDIELLTLEAIDRHEKHHAHNAANMRSMVQECLFTD
jgi:hypothetical protein